MKLFTVFLIIVLSFSVLPVNAGMEDEIQHLLVYVEDSGCMFERNGDTFDSKKARQHIQRKYDYVMRWSGSSIETAEDFIRLTATESSMSGKKYFVHCNGKSLTSAEWLLKELTNFREQKGM